MRGEIGGLKYGHKFKPILRSQGAELGCFPSFRQSCWKLQVLPIAKTEFEMLSCNFSSSLFTSLLIITGIGLEKETLSYIIMQPPQCANLAWATFLPAMLCTFLQWLLL